MMQCKNMKQFTRKQCSKALRKSTMIDKEYMCIEFLEFEVAACNVKQNSGKPDTVQQLFSS